MIKKVLLAQQDFW